MLLENGDRIIRALRQAGIGKVFSTADLAGIAEKEQVAPAVHVVLLDYAPVGTVGPEVEWREVWGVWVVVRNAARKDRSAAQMGEGAVLLSQVQEALLAVEGPYLAQDGARPLKLAENPPPAFSEMFAYFPLAFEARAET
ncbi:MAG: hypothetical protein LBO00_07220 [Zoogloeaceae bacterium]|jgi:hypothetical protein|nr:hypothetical protein [Zoogloeaceae bacterium]